MASSSGRCGWHSGSGAERAETGTRDQFQLHHVIYASGAEAGVPGKENARQARDAVRADGLLAT